MNSDSIKRTVKYGLLVTAYWAIIASYGGFMVSMAMARNYAESVVSIICASYMICVFAGQFFFGSICDKLRQRKKVFIIGIILAAVIQLAMFHFKSVLSFGILYSLFGFMSGPMGSVVDTWMLNGINYDMKIYGITRGLCSFFYASVNMIMGFIIERRGFYVMPIVSTVFVIIAVVLSIISEEAFIQNNNGTEASSISLKDIFSIMKIPSYVLLVVVIFLIGMANSPVNSLKIIVFQSVGGDVSTLGVDTFIGCMVQVILFLITGALLKISAKTRLFITALAMFIAMSIDFFAVAPWMVIVGSLFMNMHYGFLMPALRETIGKVVDSKYQTTANSVADAFYGSLSGAVSLLYAGSLAENYSVKIMILSCVLIAIIPVTIMGIRMKNTNPF